MRLYKYLSSASSKAHPWRQSATVMLATQVKDELGLLMMTRSRKSRFMPGALVFPGGAISPVDGSTEWIKLYQDHGVDLLTSQALTSTFNRPYIYQREYPQYDSELLPSEISLRLTSIRELFEECGVLLCTSSPEAKKPLPDDQDLAAEWQDRVRNDPDEFLKMCKELEALPDVSSLCEWSNWLTPSSIKIRFDTVFFVTTVPQVRKIRVDPNEAEDANWVKLSDLIDENGVAKQDLQPPQVYELFRLRNIKSIGGLQELMKHRREKGIERWFPVIMKLKDGLLNVLPGDDLYPSQVDDINPSEILAVDMTLEEASRNCKNFHRIERLADGRRRLRIEGAVRHGHVYS